MILEEKIKKIIQDSGLSLFDFAQRVGVSKNTIINYRDGKTSPSAEFIIKICKEFSVNPTSLILDKGALYLTKEEKSAIEIIGSEKFPIISEKEAATLLVFEAMKETGIILTPRGIEKLTRIISDEIWEGMKESAVRVLKALVKVLPGWESELKGEYYESFSLMFNREKKQISGLKDD